MSEQGSLKLNGLPNVLVRQLGSLSWKLRIKLVIFEKVEIFLLSFHPNFRFHYIENIKKSDI